MAKVFVTPASQSALTLLAGAVTGVIVVGSLFWAQTVLIPVALAVFLAFPLAPLVSALQRWRLGRKPSVVVVVLLATLVFGGGIWLVKVELTSLANDLPTYTENIEGKINYFRQMGHGAGMERLGKLFQDVAGEWEKALGSGATKLPTPVAKAPPAVPEKSDAARVPAENPAWLSRAPAFLSAMMASFSRSALALILVVFMLLEREALRNRLIRLVGDGRMTATTKALDDAGERISRYLLRQLTINGVYGFIWATALYFIGVDYALLWGFLAAMLRYVPYVGAPSAALLPIALSLAQFSSWWPPIAVVGLFLILELVCNAVEPWLYGQTIGVSAVAMVVSAAFWTFLWGPIGLVLSGPLTVCLVVLGKHIPELEFFAVLLGDAPALDTDVSYYQRLLARDQDEAAQLVMAHVKTADVEHVYDELLIPALVYAKRDRERDFLTEADEQFIFQATQEVLEDLGERQSAALLEEGNVPTAESGRAAHRRIRILTCPARDRADKLAIEMLKQLLNPDDWDVEITALETLTAELVEHVSDERSTLVCIGALPPGGLAHTRYLCKRLRSRCPDLKIIVGRWGLKENFEANREQLQEVGADLMATTLLETRKLLNDWLPVLTFQVENPSSATDAAPQLLPESTDADCAVPVGNLP